jgi:hypothetical protein
MSGATINFVDHKLRRWPICVFAKRGDPDCLRAKAILDRHLAKVPFGLCDYVEIECRQDCTPIENYLMKLSLNDSRKVRSESSHLKKKSKMKI